jgi:hypothetical protein
MQLPPLIVLCRVQFLVLPMRKVISIRGIARPVHIFVSIVEYSPKRACRGHVRAYIECLSLAIKQHICGLVSLYTSFHIVLLATHIARLLSALLWRYTRHSKVRSYLRAINEVKR